IALGIIITIYKDGQETRIELPPNSQAKIGADGSVAVKLAGGTMKSVTAAGETQPIFVGLQDIPLGSTLTPELLRLELWPKDKLPQGALTMIEQLEGRRTRTKLYAGEPILQNKLFSKSETRLAPAKSDFEAIQGTWQVVSSSFNLFPMVGRAEGVTRDELIRTTKVVITQDAFKFLGEHVVDVAYQYQLNPTSSPKIIDLKAGSKIALGVYELAGDQLRVCALPAFSHSTEKPQRPKAVWAEYGSGKELLVLKRIGNAVLAPDETAIQGEWEVIRSEGQLPHQELTYSFADDLRHRKVRITRHDLAIKGLAYEKSQYPGLRAPLRGTTPWQPVYALDPNQAPKTIDLVYYFSEWLGIYELKGDQLTICFGKTRPSGFEAKPGEDRVLIEMRRVRDVSAVPDAEAIQGTWQIVSSSRGPQQSQLLLCGSLMLLSGSGATPDWADAPLSGSAAVPDWADVPLAEVWKTSKVVITRDAFKVRGRHVLNVTHKYQVNPDTSPKMIDLLVGGQGILGVYELQGDQLKICLDWGMHPQSGRRSRPEALWAELGSSQELLTLRRVGEAKLEADEQAIQGKWEVVRAWAKITETFGNMTTQRMYSAPYGEIAKGRKVVINESELVIKGLPEERAESDDAKKDGAGTAEAAMFVQPDFTQPMAHDDLFRYALDPSQDPKRIDFTGAGYPCQGVYRLEGDRFMIRLGKGRPEAIDGPPADGEVLLELKLVEAAPTSVDQTAARSAQESDIGELSPDGPEAPGTAADAKAIQGTWKGSVETTEKSPEGDEESQSYPVKLVVTESGFSYYSADNQLGGAFEYTIDPTKKPKSIDFSRAGMTVSPGIYRLDGDRLKVMMPVEDPVLRPKSFFLPAYSNCHLFDVRRDGGPGSAATPGGRDALAVHVDRDGQVSVRGKPHDPASLQKLLRQLLEHDPQTTVRISAEPQTEHRHVVAILDLVKAAGVGDVSIVVGKPPAPARLDFRTAATRKTDGKHGLEEAEIKRYIDDLSSGRIYRHAEQDGSGPREDPYASEERAYE
ncbi:MAG: TIGR03067 domain-containing protein, partial [Planctomycetota bacterium]